MSSHTGFAELARELRALRNESTAQDHTSASSVLVMRRVVGLTPQRWQEFCNTFPLSRWGAVPLTAHHAALCDTCLADLRPDVHPYTAEGTDPSPLARLLSYTLLTQQLERELHRLQRSGGELTLVCCDGNPSPTTNTACDASAAHASGDADALFQDLPEIIQKRLDICDSLGLFETQGYCVLLPGYGILRGRMLVEKIRLDLEQCPHTDNNTKTALPFGLVTLRPTEQDTAEKVLQRAFQALQKARTEPTALYCDMGAPLSERTTLVHSQEKRFLFFGGD